MANVLVEKQDLVNTANAIRSKLGSADLMTPAEMAEKVETIETGGTGIDLSEPYVFSDYGVLYYKPYTYFPTYLTFDVYLQEDKNFHHVSAGADIEPWFNENGIWNWYGQFIVDLDNDCFVYEYDEWDMQYDEETDDWREITTPVEKRGNLEDIRFEIIERDPLVTNQMLKQVSAHYDQWAQYISVGEMKKLELTEEDFQIFSTDAPLNINNKSYLSNGDTLYYPYMRRLDIGTKIEFLSTGFMKNCNSPQTIIQFGYHRKNFLIEDDVFRNATISKIGLNFGSDELTYHSFTLGQNTTIGRYFCYGSNIENVKLVSGLIGDYFSKNLTLGGLTEIGTNFTGKIEDGEYYITRVGVGFNPVIRGRLHDFSRLTEIPDNSFNDCRTSKWPTGDYDYLRRELRFSSVERIGNNCFTDCTSSVEFSSTKPLTIGNYFCKRALIGSQFVSSTTIDDRISFDSKSITFGDYAFSDATMICKYWQNAMFSDGAIVDVGSYFMYRANLTECTAYNTYRKWEIPIAIRNAGDYFMAEFKGLGDTKIVAGFNNTRRSNLIFLGNYAFYRASISTLDLVFAKNGLMIGEWFGHKSDFSLVYLPVLATIPQNMCSCCRSLDTVIFTGTTDNYAETDTTSFVAINSDTPFKYYIFSGTVKGKVCLKTSSNSLDKLRAHFPEAQNRNIEFAVF